MNQHHSDRPPVSRMPASAGDQARSHDQPQSRPLPLYKVILLYDACLDMMFIVRTVMELTRFGRAEATHRMWEAHYGGRSVLLITYKERAELYAEQFAEKGLTVSIEPA